MKKRYIIPAALVCTLSLASFAYAGVTTTGGAQVRITDTTGGTGGTLKFDTSPGVIMGWNTATASFAINGINKTVHDAGDNGLEFGMASDSNQMYKQSLAKATTHGAPNAADSSGLW